MLQRSTSIGHGGDSNLFGKIEKKPVDPGRDGRHRDRPCTDLGRNCNYAAGSPPCGKIPFTNANSASASLSADVVFPETGTLEEIADAENINPSYVSRLLRMTLLAPEIVEAILAGNQPAGLTRTKAMQLFPMEWQMQTITLSRTNPD